MNRRVLSFIPICHHYRTKQEHRIACNQAPGLCHALREYPTSCSWPSLVLIFLPWLSDWHRSLNLLTERYSSLAGRHNQIHDAMERACQVSMGGDATVCFSFGVADSPVVMDCSPDR